MCGRDCLIRNRRRKGFAHVISLHKRIWGKRMHPPHMGLFQTLLSEQTVIFRNGCYWFVHVTWYFRCGSFISAYVWVNGICQILSMNRNWTFWMYLQKGSPHCEINSPAWDEFHSSRDVVFICRFKFHSLFWTKFRQVRINRKCLGQMKLKSNFLEIPVLVEAC